ncbi:MAG: hypothetical protein ACE5H4_15845 [Candidatus Thorarchaeota archaeon]
MVPRDSVVKSSRLSLSSGSALKMLSLGVSAFSEDSPMHLDGIDVFITPFMRGAEFVCDYHVPLVPELLWLGHIPIAAAARALLPSNIRMAKAIIAPNRQMLAHASTYARLPDYFIVPNYPRKSFYMNISQEEARVRLNLPLDRQIALFVGGGRLREIYGIDLLLETWLKVRRNTPEALLCILGPVSHLWPDQDTMRGMRNKGIILSGNVEYSDVPLWIAAADVCLSQRTPGFPANWYNIHDSLKLSEYALFEKPIVVAGYLPGPDYISAETTVDSYSEAVLEGLRGNAPRPTPHTWEENLPTIRKAYKALL